MAIPSEKSQLDETITKVQRRRRQTLQKLKQAKCGMEPSASAAVIDQEAGVTASQFLQREACMEGAPVVVGADEMLFPQINFQSVPTHAVMTIKRQLVTRQ